MQHAAHKQRSCFCATCHWDTVSSTESDIGMFTPCAGADERGWAAAQCHVQRDALRASMPLIIRLPHCWQNCSDTTETFSL